MDNFYESLLSLEKWRTVCPYCGNQVWLYGERRAHTSSCPLGQIISVLGNLKCDSCGGKAELKYTIPLCCECAG